MSLRLREKQRLYHNLAQLVRAGVTFPAALQKLVPSTRGSLRSLLTRLNQSIDAGATVAEAFAAQRPAISDLEAGIVAAVERAGRLDRGLAQLSEYFGALETARAGAWKKAAYPIFILHFGVLILGVTRLISEGLVAYLRETGLLLGLFYAVALLIACAVPVLTDAGARSAAIDRLLRLLPLIGAIRTNFAVSRFCATYEMQLGAGVNVMDSLKAAGRASRSGLIAGTVARAIPGVLKGEQVSTLLAQGEAFPEAVVRDLAVAETTGQLDVELSRLNDEHRQIALSKLDSLTEWLPRLIYLAVVGYLGFRIVGFYAGYLRQVQEITEQIH